MFQDGPETYMQQIWYLISVTRVEKMLASSRCCESARALLRERMTMARTLPVLAVLAGSDLTSCLISCLVSFLMALPFLPDELSHLPVNKPIAVLAEMRWLSSKTGREYRALGSSEIILVRRKLSPVYFGASEATILSERGSFRSRSNIGPKMASRPRLIAAGARSAYMASAPSSLGDSAASPPPRKPNPR